MRTLTTLIVVTCVVAAAWGQAPSPAPKPDPGYKAYEVLIGDWQYEGQAQDSPIGPGGKFAGKQSARWVLGGFFMEMRGQEQGNLGALEWVEYDWYDPTAKNYPWQGHMSIGDTYSGVTTVSGNVWKFTGTQTHKGIAYKIRGETRFAADRMSSTWKSEISADGKTWAPWTEGKATKVVNPTAAAEQELIQLAKSWGAAMVSGDAAALERILAEEIMDTDPVGRPWTKAQSIAALKSGTMKATSWAMDDMKVHVYGDTAVVTGRTTLTGRFHGEDISGQYRWTDTFVRRDGRWQCVATHASRITEAGDDKLVRPSAAQLERNKAVIERIFDEVFNAGNLDAIDEIYHEDFVRHDPDGTVSTGTETHKSMVARIRRTIPDYRENLQLMIVEGDLIACRWISSGTDRKSGSVWTRPCLSTFRFQDGKIIEQWLFFGSQSQS